MPGLVLFNHNIRNKWLFRIAAGEHRGDAACEFFYVVRRQRNKDLPFAHAEDQAGG